MIELKVDTFEWGTGYYNLRRWDDAYRNHPTVQTLDSVRIRR